MTEIADVTSGWWPTLLGVVLIALGGLATLIVPPVARTKGRGQLLAWWVYGIALFPVALLHVLLMSSQREPSP